MPPTSTSAGGGLIGEAPAFLAMLEHVSGAAALAKPVLVIGERGTGKELIAARLHYLSPRWEQPLVKVNCAALTETLLETELFGHQAGAFTGATRTHFGRFEQANGGTLVLDELGTIPLRMQEKILRVIEYGEFERVGGSDTLRTDVRIVGATNENLPRLVELGRFRPDLLDRLAFDVVHVPPLRARPEDIRALAQHFAVNVTSELKRPFFPGFAPAAIEALLAYGWPGNVRELKNAIERSVYRAAEPDKPLEEIRFDPFASPFAADHSQAPASALSASDAAAAAHQAADRSASAAAGAAADAATEAAARAGTPDGERAAATAAPSAGGRAARLPNDFRKAVAEFEVDLLQHALARAQHKQTTAARLIGLTYHQFRSLLRKHGLNRSGETAE